LQQLRSSATGTVRPLQGTHRYSRGLTGCPPGCSQGTVSTQLNPLLPQAGIGRKWESAVSANRRGAHGVLPGYCEYCTQRNPLPALAGQRGQPLGATDQSGRSSGAARAGGWGQRPLRGYSRSPASGSTGVGQLGLFVCLFVWLFASSLAACGRPRASVCVPHIALERFGVGVVYCPLAL
jgi:hypothetical protein